MLEVGSSTGRKHEFGMNEIGGNIFYQSVKVVDISIPAWAATATSLFATITCQKSRCTNRDIKC